MLSSQIILDDSAQFQLSNQLSDDRIYTTSSISISCLIFYVSPAISILDGYTIESHVEFNRVMKIKIKFYVSLSLVRTVRCAFSVYRRRKSTWGRT